MTSILQSEPGQIVIIYDGECPFCSTYVKMVRLRESFEKITLIDARRHPEYVSAMTAQGMDINQGMLVIQSNQLYFGAEAIHIIALFTTRSSFFNHLTAFTFSNARVSRILYPLCRLGRNLALKFLGRQKIDKNNST